MMSFKYCRPGKFHKAHTLMKLKHRRLFTMTVLLLNNYVYIVHASSFHSAHLYMPNVCDNNVYEAQTCILFVLLVDCTDKCTG